MKTTSQIISFIFLLIFVTLFISGCSSTTRSPETKDIETIDVYKDFLKISPSDILTPIAAESLCLDKKTCPTGTVHIQGSLSRSGVLGVFVLSDGSKSTHIDLRDTHTSVIDMITFQEMTSLQKDGVVEAILEGTIYPDSGMCDNSGCENYVSMLANPQKVVIVKKNGCDINGWGPHSSEHGEPGNCFDTSYRALSLSEAYSTYFSSNLCTEDGRRPTGEWSYDATTSSWRFQIDYPNRPGGCAESCIVQKGKVSMAKCYGYMNMSAPIEEAVDVKSIADLYQQCVRAGGINKNTNPNDCDAYLKQTIHQSAFFIENSALPENLATEKTSPSLSKTTENLDTQCSICPGPCRDKEGKIIDDLNETGSCVCLRKNNECVRTMQRSVYVAPDLSPDHYLGADIGKEAQSDWMNYAPLKQKVQELVADKTNDLEKVKAIATWVAHSKTYKISLDTNGEFTNFGPTSDASVANQGGTIIDIFEAKEGVCLDAAMETAAMLRLAGIPAMSVEPAIKGALPHQVTYFYTDGRWRQVDATYGQETIQIKEASDPSVAEVSFASSYLCSDTYSEGYPEPSAEFTYYLDYPTTIGDHGMTCIPFLAKYGQRWDAAYLSPQSKDGEYKWLFRPGYSLGDSFANLKNNWPHWTMDQDNICPGPHYEYLYCLPMPSGKYRVTYDMTVPGGSSENNAIPIATLNFEIKNGRNTTLTRSNFVKDSTIGQEEYATFIKHIEKVLSYSQN